MGRPFGARRIREIDAHCRIDLTIQGGTIWPHTALFAARRYRCCPRHRPTRPATESVQIVSVVATERKFVQVERQIVLRDLG